MLLFSGTENNSERKMKGRKALPLKGIKDHDFKKLAASEGTARERRRYLVFAHIQEGKSYSAAAQMVKVEPRTVLTWVKKFRKEGLEGLKEKPGRGAKSCLPSEKDEALRQAVEAMQAKRGGGRIRGKDIMQIIEELQGIRPSKSSVYRILSRAKLVWITARSKHPKANEEAQEAFKKTL